MKSSEAVSEMLKEDRSVASAMDRNEMRIGCPDMREFFEAEQT
jgi:hypothetical protein